MEGFPLTMRRGAMSAAEAFSKKDLLEFEFASREVVEVVLL